MSAGVPGAFVAVKAIPGGWIRTVLACPAEPPLADGDLVIVQTDSGPALASVVARPAAILNHHPQPDQALRVLRRASGQDRALRARHEQREREAVRLCGMKIRERGLAMKLARVEQMFDGSRLVFFFTSEERVDFRELVRELASEFKYFTPPVKDLVIGVTQSGETADTLAALRKAKVHNCPTLAVTNVQGSTVTRLADRTLLMRAGPEIGVAATKSFIAQLAVFMELANAVCDGELDEMLSHAHLAISEAIAEDLASAVELCQNADHIFFVGRGPFYPVALEGALKMKEISYIPAEGYAAGELKHGPFALLTQKTTVVAICTPGNTYDVMKSNIKEMKARGAPVIAIGTKGDTDLAEIVDVFVPIPETSFLLELLTTSVIFQLLSYHTARALERDIDKPRNLAKSVTVE
jgi:fructoselysine-6-P-deglycase FrlB-like protein